MTTNEGKLAKVVAWFAQRRKAIAGVLVPLAVFTLAKYGFEASNGWALALSAVLTGAGVEHVKNAEPPAEVDSAPGLIVPDRGQVSIGLIAAVVLGVILAYALLRVLGAI